MKVDILKGNIKRKNNSVILLKKVIKAPKKMNFIKDFDFKILELFIVIFRNSY